MSIIRNMYKACGLVCKVEDFKSASNNFRSEFIGKDQTGRKQYRGISFKKTLFGDIEDCNYYPLVKELIILAGKKKLLEAIKDHCRENYAMECLVLKSYEHWQVFPEQAPEPDKWIFYFDGIKMLSGSL